MKQRNEKLECETPETPLPRIHCTSYDQILIVSLYCSLVYKNRAWDGIGASGVLRAYLPRNVPVFGELLPGNHGTSRMKEIHIHKGLFLFSKLARCIFFFFFFLNEHFSIRKP